MNLLICFNITQCKWSGTNYSFLLTCFSNTERNFIVYHKNLFKVGFVLKISIFHFFAFNGTIYLPEFFL